jgi:hypothetical protein
LPDLVTENAKNYPLPWREGMEGRGILFSITLTPTLSHQGRGFFFLHFEKNEEGPIFYNEEQND